jgi:hypothetical protein
VIVDPERQKNNKGLWCSLLSSFTALVTWTASHTFISAISSLTCICIYCPSLSNVHFSAILSNFPRAEKRADHGPFARGISLWVWIRLKMLAQPALEASSTRDDGMKARKEVCVDSGIAWEMVKPREEWLILSFLLSISSGIQRWYLISRWKTGALP